MKLVLTGGFLGSGKTTAISNACTQLFRENKKVAVITNDQGEQQVDSAHFSQSRFPIREVANGCFCCNYTLLDEHIHSLTQEQHPEIIFAESVGSCTDLVATIAKPLARFRPELDVVISVFADASLLLSLLEGRASFIAENIRYIYKKQLEEADILVINKIDLIDADQLSTIELLFNTDFPGKLILKQNSTKESDISTWLKTVLEFKATTARSSLQIDYDLYADGEAQLAWLDKKVSISSPVNNTIAIAIQLAKDINDAFRSQDLVIGHLKFFIETKRWKKKLSYTITDDESDLQIAGQFSNECDVLINARIQSEPEFVKKLVDDILEKTSINHDCKIVVNKWASFKPGYPRPTHRIA